MSQDQQPRHWWRGRWLAWALAALTFGLVIIAIVGDLLRPNVSDNTISLVQALFSLIQAIAWPIVALIVAFLFRQHLPKFVQSLIGRISSLSTGPVASEFVAAKPNPEVLDALEYISKASSPYDTSEHISHLLGIVEKSPSADYLVIDLRDGKAWLTSRLYLFAVVLPPTLGVRCFVFVSAHGQLPRYFLGLASVESVARALERRYPWLYEVRRERMARRPTKIKIMARRRTSKDNGQSSDKDNGQGSDKDWFQVSPLPWHMRRYGEHPLENERDLIYEEHARLIENERDLVDLIGEDFHREQVTNKEGLDSEALKDEMLRKRGSFVALTDPEGRFRDLINRSALLEAVATEIINK